MSLDIKKAALDFLKRCDKAYSVYDFLIRKDAKSIDDDDFEAVINAIEEQYDIVKNATKAFKDGYKSVGILINDYETEYLRYRVADITMDEVNNYLKNNNLDSKYSCSKIIRCTDNLSVM